MPTEGAPWGLATWLYDFQFELQVSPSWNTTDQLSIVTPDGVALGFQRQSNGSMTPVLPSNYGEPQTDYTLALIGSWPSDLTTLTSAPTAWTLTGPDDTVYTIQTFFDPRTNAYTVGRPVQIARRDGLTDTLAYGTQGQLTSVTDSYGKSITFDWIVDDYTPYGGNITPMAISAAHLPNGYKVVYNYTTVGGAISGAPPQPDELTNVQYLNSTGAVKDQVTYQYGDAAFPTFITGILDANSVQRWAVTYDANGHATSSAGPNGAEIYTVSYGAVGAPGTTFTRTVTDPLGRASTYTFKTASSGAGLISIDGAASTHCPASAASYTYGGDGLLASQTDENGNVTQFTHDPRGMPTQVVEASGTASARTTTSTWDATRHVPTQIVAPGLTTTFSYDTGSGSGSGGGGFGTGKRFWRIRFTGSGGGSPYSVRLSEIQLFGAAGGPELARSATNVIGTANSSYPNRNANNGSIGDLVLFNASSAPPYVNVYWGIDFGPGADERQRGHHYRSGDFGPDPVFAIRLHGRMVVRWANLEPSVVREWSVRLANSRDAAVRQSDLHLLRVLLGEPPTLARLPPEQDRRQVHCCRVTVPIHAWRRRHPRGCDRFRQQQLSKLPAPERARRQSGDLLVAAGHVRR